VMIVAAFAYRQRALCEVLHRGRIIFRLIDVNQGRDGGNALIRAAFQR